ncbi:MAG: phosphomannomutase/phosphoglucomutase [Cryobacterium sp.]
MSSLNDALAHLNAVVTKYDVRGVVGENLTPEIVTALGAAFADELGAAGSEIIIGHDARESSPGLVLAFAEGVQARGASAVLIGLCSTDEVSYASGSSGLAAVMVTASHNPPDWNGLKFSGPGATAMSRSSGLDLLEDRAAEYLGTGITAVATPGTRREADVLADYARHLRSLVDLSELRPLRVVVDAGNGTGALIVPAVLNDAAGLPALPVEVLPLFFELDGSFPGRGPNPLESENLTGLRQAVLAQGADLGVAFDGDADRCIVVDEAGAVLSASTIAAILAQRVIALERDRTEGTDESTNEIIVLHNAVTSRAVAEAVRAAGGVAVPTRVGHSLVKEDMRETGALFASEHSGHYYWRELWGADSGMLAAMHLFAVLGAPGAATLSVTAADFAPYAASGEINLTVDDIAGVYARIVETFTGAADFDYFDGLTVCGLTSTTEPFWWFNVRASQTEPVLRLNVEAATATVMVRIRDSVLALIES